MSETTGVDVHSVLFRPDERVEITYAERAELTENVSVVRTLVLDANKYKSDLGEIEEFLVDLIDTVLTDVRNPPERVPADRRER